MPCLCTALYVLKVCTRDAMQAERSQGHREVITAHWHASVMPVAVAQAHNTTKRECHNLQQKAETKT